MTALDNLVGTGEEGTNSCIFPCQCEEMCQSPPPRAASMGQLPTGNSSAGSRARCGKEGQEIRQCTAQAGTAALDPPQQAALSGHHSG